VNVFLSFLRLIEIGAEAHKDRVAYTRQYIGMNAIETKKSLIAISRKKIDKAHQRQLNNAFHIKMSITVPP
jgi:hypothetical protein